MTNPTEQAIEKEIVDKGKTAPRLSPIDIDAAILSEHYLHGAALPGASNTAIDEGFPTTKAALGCLTICVLVLKNGFTIVGKSACASPENFDAELGAKIAREDARRQIWALEGYQLRTKLASAA